MKRKVFFRADVGQGIGYGHFIRSLALADMLKEEFECVFYTQTPTDYQKIEMTAVCPFVELPSDDSRFDLFLEVLKGDEIVVLDNYFYTTDYQIKVKSKGCKLVCIDDMHDKHFVSDAVVCHGRDTSIHIDCEAYTRLCLGEDWALLRRPFLEPIKALDREKQIVVCLGGSDPNHLTDRIVSFLVELKVPYKIVVVLGDAASLCSKNSKEATVLRNLSAQEMATLFESSSMGIFPTSSVAKEARSRGLNVLSGYFVDNQRIGYEKILKNNDFVPLFNLNELTKDRLAAALKEAEHFSFNVPDYSHVPDNFKKLFSSL